MYFETQNKMAIHYSSTFAAKSKQKWCCWMLKMKWAAIIVSSTYTHVHTQFPVILNHFFDCQTGFSFQLYFKWSIRLCVCCYVSVCFELFFCLLILRVFLRCMNRIPTQKHLKWWKIAVSARTLHIENRIFRWFFCVMSAIYMRHVCFYGATCVDILLFLCV